jgi:hypothetical protein
MDKIRVMYEHQDKTWMADSPDFEALSDSVLIAGAPTYEAARARIEDLMPWALERDDIVLEHFVRESSLPKLVAERQAAEAAQQPVATVKR